MKWGRGSVLPRCRCSWSRDFQTVRGSVVQGDDRLHLRLIGFCRYMEGHLIQGWGRLLPRCAAPPGLPLVSRAPAPSQEIMGWGWSRIFLWCCWLHDRQLTRNEPMVYLGLGFPYCAGRYRPGRSLRSSPMRSGYGGMEVFLTKGWGLTFPG